MEGHQRPRVCSRLPSDMHVVTPRMCSELPRAVEQTSCDNGPLVFVLFFVLVFFFYMVLCYLSALPEGVKGCLGLSPRGDLIGNIYQSSEVGYKGQRSGGQAQHL